MIPSAQSLLPMPVSTILFNLLECLLDDSISPVSAADTGLHHLVQLARHLHCLNNTGCHHTKGGSSSSKLRTEDALGFGRILIHQQLNDCVKALLWLGSLLENWYSNNCHSLKWSRCQLPKNLFVAFEIIKLDRFLDLLSVHGVLSILLVTEDGDVTLTTFSALKVGNKGFFQFLHVFNLSRNLQVVMRIWTFPWCDWLTSNISDRLLTHVEPNQFVLGHLLRNLWEPRFGGLSHSINRKSWNSSPMWQFIWGSPRMTPFNVTIS